MVTNSVLNRHQFSHLRVINQAHHQTLHGHFNAVICIASLSSLYKQRGAKDIEIRELLAWQSFDRVKKNMPSHSVGSHVSEIKVLSSRPLLDITHVSISTSSIHKKISEALERFLKSERSSWNHRNFMLQLVTDTLKKTICVSCGVAQRKASAGQQNI